MRLFSALRFYIAIGLVSFFLFSGNALGWKSEPKKIDGKLSGFTDILGEGRWPKICQKPIFKTKKGSKGLESTAKVICKEYMEKKMDLIILIVAQSYGVAIQSGAPIKRAIVMLDMAKKVAAVDLPLKECKAMGKALLAKKQDKDKTLDAIFAFTAAYYGKVLIYDKKK